MLKFRMSCQVLTHGLSSKKTSRGQELRVFVKCMARIIVPPNSNPASVAPSLLSEPQLNIENANGSSYPYYPFVQEPLNPTILPLSSLRSFQFTFLIRNPRLSIPSIYRLSTPPRCAKTGWLFFSAEDAGYLELRRLFDYARQAGLIGPQLAGKNRAVSTISSSDGEHHECPIVIVDADDLLDDPAGVMSVYCNAVGIPFSADMLDWSSAEKKDHGEKVFKKFEPFHEKVLNSSGISAPSQRLRDIRENDEYEAWIAEFGETGAATIKEVVHANMEHYNYLKQFSLKV